MRRSGHRTMNVEYAPVQEQFVKDLDEVVASIRKMLIEKNAAYGDSALNPVRIFSKSSALEQIDVRIDDKLSRIVRGSSSGEDVHHDLLGYLIMRRIAINRNEKAIRPYNPT